MSHPAHPHHQASEDSMMSVIQTDDDIEICLIQDDDIEDVLVFLRKFFFKDEPLNVEQNLLETEDARCLELEEICTETMKEHLSFKATSKGQILGVTINGVSRPGKAVDSSEECKNPKFKKILKLLYTIDKQSDVFGQFPDVSSTIDVKIISVDNACRGRGIAKALIDRTREFGAENGHAMIRVDCTSHFSAKAVARLGFECVYILKYSEYLGPDGKPVFTPEPPHNEVKVFVQRI
ncbi:arylalkylamine N-acetyltransferase 1-like isoform X2 [Chrysoperla carnea]|nr:arylalkylamine N-acetyltransferase 1-like isoform X2 [Chrysoperla carnea]